MDNDGKLSADEDFANNIEYFMFDPDQLKVTSPQIFGWIQKHLKQQLQLEKECKDEK